MKTSQRAVRPKVSVCVRVHNGEPYLTKAMQSLLMQTYTDFEIIVVDDGSTDGTADTLAAINDPRIRVVTIPHLGLARATAIAIEAATGEYIAIMDADDISEPDRLARQIEVLESEPRVVVVGSAMTIIDAQGIPRGKRSYPIDDVSVRGTMLCYNPFGHPTVVFRANALRDCGSYSDRFATVEDYDLYFRLLKFGEGRNVPQPLLRYRVHQRSVKSSKTKLQLRETIALRRVAIYEYGWRHDLRSSIIDLVQRMLLQLPATLIAFAFERMFYRKPSVR